MSRGVRRGPVILRLFAALLLLQAVISVRTELVAVPVTVTDASGHHVRGLSQENFRVFEDGRPQPIAVFQRADVPLTLGLIVDRSQSMRPKTPALLAAVSALVQACRPDDEMFAVTFNDRVSFALPGGRPFTSDGQEIAAALVAVEAGGQTALYDGVAEGLQHLQLGHAGKHALIVVSDGGDNASREPYARILTLARGSDVVIYAIGLLDTSAVAQEEEDEGLLKRLCADTGGVAYFPRTPDEIAAMSADVARDLREQYTLGFTPSERTDGRAFRTIRVTVTAAGQGRLHVRTRAGYLVGRDKDAKHEEHTP
jgi:Ca-activated chloride channel homolog